MNYKTPGVYIEEVSKFPPSVAQVETAIPAFIGHTAVGKDTAPTRISSMMEYEELFGGANSEKFLVTFNEGEAIASEIAISNFKMYYAVQMYFANGGGSCYIVSVGDYNDEITQTKLLDGLELLRKEDEVTLIVFPDLQNLVATDEEVLLAESDKEAASLAVTLALEAETAATEVFEAVEDATSITLLIDSATTSANGFEKPTDSSDPEYLKEMAAHQAALAVLNAVKTAALIEDAGISDVKNAAEVVLNKYKENLLMLQTILPIVVDNLDKIEYASDPDNIESVYNIYNAALEQARVLKDRFVILDVLGDEDIFRDEVNALELKYGAAYYPNLKTILSYKFNDEDVFVMGVLGVANLAQLKSTNSELYHKAKKAVESNKVILAPSSTMAGVYAKVDSTSGVWKSPANVGLNYVTGPEKKISDKEQEDLNIHTTGKSINAIRTFTGKGTLVWGARTLDGCSNEWRYVSVRRFFNMVEESVKKATEVFLFEPNTANTWIRVQTMIENFLNEQWKAGALAGSKPEDAYYVCVNSKTITAQDILEGRMIIEIGMATVRPAEFIVLRFSHKLQEA